MDDPTSSWNQSPTRAPRIETEGELGRGGMASIRRVHDRLLGRHMAMKVLDLSLPQQELRRRFLREAQLLGQLDHPHIVPLYELGEDDAGTPCFTMKLVDGRTLAEVVSDGDVLAEPGRLAEIIRVLVKVCDAISFANSRGVVHRDLKPENVMIGSHGQVYVMDWGIAHVLDDAQLARAGVPAERRVRCDRVLEEGFATGIIGTPAFMAPEQALCQMHAIDARTDVFGVGGLLYHVLTGRAPREGDDVVSLVMRARDEDIIPPEEAGGRGPLPRGLCRIARRALARDPDARYPTAEALKYDLERYMLGGAFRPQRFAAGSFIIKEGESGDAAYIIGQGHCEASKIESGRKVVLRRMGPGEVFGETAILTGQPRSASVVAVDDVTVMTVTAGSLLNDLGLDSWMGALVRTVAERFRDLDGRLSELRRDHLKLRVRERILTAAAGGRAVPWSPLCAALVAETGLTELDILAIAADADDLELDQTGNSIRVAATGRSGRVGQLRKR